MNAQELRIGNLLRTAGSLRSKKPRYFEVTPEDLETIYLGYSNAAGIEITTEVLLKLGWKDIGSDDFHKGHLWVIPGCDYQFHQDHGFVWNLGDYGHYCDIGNELILFVHQLQNGYYFLTGQELNIEL